MLKKLASPKRKSLAQAKDLAASGDESGAAPQQESPSKPQQESPSKPQQSEDDPKAEGQTEGQVETHDGQHSQSSPKLERQPRRQSVLEEKPPLTSDKKGPSKFKATTKPAKKGDVRAIPEEKSVDTKSSDTGKEEIQDAHQHLEETPSTTRKGKSERGFLKSFAQVTRGHGASTTGDQHAEASADTAKETPKTKKKSKEKQSTQDAKTEEASSPGKKKQKEKLSRLGGKQNNREDHNKGENEPSKDKKLRAMATGSMSPIRRRTPSKSDKIASRPSKLKNQFAPLSQTEVHMIGEIIGGGGFPDNSDGLICKYHVDYGNCWAHISGDELGQTQIAYPSRTSGSNQLENVGVAAVWAHPIDVHFATSAFQGWPKLVFQVWRVDTHMSTRIAGYGYVSVPFAAGEYDLTVQLWRPMGGSWASELSAQLTGNTPELVTDDVVARSAITDRCRLQTVATGCVNIRVGVLLRNLDLLNETRSR